MTLNNYFPIQLVLACLKAKIVASNTRYSHIECQMQLSISIEMCFSLVAA